MTEVERPGPTPPPGAGRPPAVPGPGRPAGPPSGPPSGPLNAGPSPQRPSPDRRPPRRRILLFALVGGLVLVVGLVGVLLGAGAFDGGGGGGGSGSVSVREGEATAGTPPPPAEPSPSSFGRTQRYADGVEVTVSEPVPFTPTAAAAGHTAGHRAVTMSVTVRNGSGARLELAVVTVMARDGAGRELGRVFDTTPDLGIGLAGSVAPGKRAVAAYGFDVPPGSGAGSSVLDVEVRIGFDRPPLLWTGTAP